MGRLEAKRARPVAIGSPHLRDWASGMTDPTGEKAHCFAPPDLRGFMFITLREKDGFQP